MAFCTNCGAEISAGARFCNSCGKEQVPSENTCSKCGKVFEDDEKFCSSCGTPVNSEPPKPSPKAESEGQKYTEEGRKIISGGPKNNKPLHTPPPPPINPQPGKKKKGCLGCFITTLIVVAILVAGAMLVINFATDWFDIIKEEWNKTTQVESLPSHQETENPAENQNQEFTQPETTTIPGAVVTESKDVIGAAKNLETIFEKSDIRALQSMLTETSAEQYKEVLEEIQPHMPEYAKAFKNRKLVYSTPVFAQYTFSDNEGNEYTVEFAPDVDGLWKLVRF